MAKRPYRGPKIYRPLYQWLDRDKTTDALLSHIRNLHLSFHRVHEISGVATGTLTNWDSGKTRKPQNMVQMAVASSLGLARADYFDKGGNIVPDYKRMRDLDWRAEIEKQGTFILKHGTDRQKAAIKKRRDKRKANGK